MVSRVFSINTKCQIRVCGSCGTKKLWSETGLRQWKGRFHRCTVLWHSLCRLNTLAVGNALPQKSSDGCLGIFLFVVDGTGWELHLFSPQGFPLHFGEKCVSIKRVIRRSDAERRWVQDVQNCDRRGSGRNTGKPEPIRPAICAGAGPAGGDPSHHRRC